jgi:nucleotide-binding universal stress UspA family protein
MANDEPTPALETSIRERSLFRLLLVVADVQETEVLFPLAQAIVGERHGQLIVMHVVTLPDAESLSEGAAHARASRATLDPFLFADSGQNTEIRTVVRVGRELWSDIWSVVEQDGVDLLLVGWRCEPTAETAAVDMSDPKLAAPPCDVIAVRLGRDVAGQDWWRQVRRILLPLRGGQSSRLALDVANILANAANASITVLHASERGSQDQASSWFASLSARLRGLPRLVRSIVKFGDVPGAILEEAADYDIVVMGASKWLVTTEGWSGPLVQAVASNIRTTLITVKERAHADEAPTVSGEELLSLEINPLAAPLPVVVDKWFAENTFHSDEFSDLERLLALKRAQGVTISLGLPALNEEETVGKVIRTIKAALMDGVPLLDEIVLIDSDSTDRTREIALECGVPVRIHQQILPEYGVRRGKGEALWKSLHVLRGDIVAWIDTDIKNIHPRFVYGIIGPLLRDSRIQYVKGFYRRPLHDSGKLYPREGGRVTELTFRPLINLFFPELSGLIQPLSGEFAGRRAALEQVPFFCGYGVETGLLIDILEQHGLQAIAQVDLMERVHRNQPLASLSKMSFAIIQVVIRRLEDRHRLRLLEDINVTMKLILHEQGRYFLREEEIRDRERPPIVSLVEYCEQRAHGFPTVGEVMT